MTDTSQAAASAATPPKRDLEEAPLLLRKASKVLIAGAVLPWMTVLSTDGNVPWAFWAIGVALTFLAGWLKIEGAKARWGDKASGIAQSLAKAHPSGPIFAALAAFVLACVVAFMGKAWMFDGSHVPEFVEGATNGYSLRAVLEHATLFLGLATFAHILNYEYGGKFNPVFPLMFLGPAVAGSLNLIGAFQAFGGNGMAAVISLVGSITVAAGGCMAIYTMYVSMKQAKIEGDRKRAEQREKRKADRGSGGARRKRS